MISAATSEDAGGVATLLDAVHPDGLHTAAGLRYRLTTSPPEDHLRWWKAEQESRIVGWAVAGLDTFAAETGRAFAGVAVHPDERRRGLGSALWEAVAAHLGAVGAGTTSVSTHDDGSSKRFAAARGFRLAATDTTSAVDPRTVFAPPPPAGVDVRPLAAFDDDPRPLFRCDAETARDEPGPFDFDGMTLDAWRRHIWEHPSCDRELGMAAVVDGDVAGTTFLFADRDSGRAMNGGTGVLRAYRGRGLGLLLKQHSLARAAAVGITRVVTDNDATNAPMLAINATLGYRPLSVGHTWLREGWSPAR